MKGANLILGKQSYFLNFGASKARTLVKTDGVAAIEFALIAPILMIIVLTLIDLSIIVVEKMRLDQFTRSVSSAVVAERSDTSWETLKGEIISNFYLDADIVPEVFISEGCFCGDVASSCDSQCSIYAGDQIPDVRVLTSSSIKIDLIFLGQQELQSALEVQVR